jgi:hypothetical protein
MKSVEIDLKATCTGSREASFRSSSFAWMDMCNVS